MGCDPGLGQHRPERGRLLPGDAACFWCDHRQRHPLLPAASQCRAIGFQTDPCSQEF